MYIDTEFYRYLMERREEVFKESLYVQQSDE